MGGSPPKFHPSSILQTCFSWAAPWELRKFEPFPHVCNSNRGTCPRCRSHTYDVRRSMTKVWLHLQFSVFMAEMNGGHYLNFVQKLCPQIGWTPNSSPSFVHILYFFDWGKPIFGKTMQIPTSLVAQPLFKEGIAGRFMAVPALCPFF